MPCARLQGVVRLTGINACRHHGWARAKPWSCQYSTSTEQKATAVESDKPLRIKWEISWYAKDNFKKLAATQSFQKKSAINKSRSRQAPRVPSVDQIEHRESASHNASPASPAPEGQETDERNPSHPRKGSLVNYVVWEDLSPQAVTFRKASGVGTEASTLRKSGLELRRRRVRSTDETGRPISNATIVSSAHPSERGQAEDEKNQSDPMQRVPRLIIRRQGVSTRVARRVRQSLEWAERPRDSVVKWKYTDRPPPDMFSGIRPERYRAKVKWAKRDAFMSGIFDADGMADTGASASPFDIDTEFEGLSLADMIEAIDEFDPGREIVEWKSYK